MNATATAADAIDTRALVSELNSYLAAYASASSAPLALSSLSSQRTSTLFGPSSSSATAGADAPARGGLEQEEGRGEQEQEQEHDYTEALTHLLSTLETRRASVRTHMSRLVRGMADQLELGGRAGAGAGGTGSGNSGAGIGRRKAGGAGGAALMGAVEDIQREAERCLTALDAIPLSRDDGAADTGETPGAVDGVDQAALRDGDGADQAGRNGGASAGGGGSVHPAAMQIPP
ncbi:unnamed protein product [Tilletia laevis]|uniref:Uncharacterized protein n=1 Tax=Tilletia laevis TaxID=157183 RepID=A0A9N8LNK4_9BASI|nr:hypothetical protein CF336_g5123 [Tilletia laevis]KAE8198385.1 hypothetical protein CF335_g4399 [Tilletia laevis]CAD6899632.1 unnamed protein product [Tilletia caries]CAD6917600.1 unnamed protein product [Tilletia laevis]CAD6961978.1 unnamed protein product [Tilletia laevis]